MKKVITRPSQSQPTIFTDNVNELREYIAIPKSNNGDDQHVYHLVKEHDGYIFRSIRNKRFGHSGTSPSIREAVEKADKTSPSDIYEFENTLEMAHYLSQNFK